MKSKLSTKDLSPVDLDHLNVIVTAKSSTSTSGSNGLGVFLFTPNVV